MNRALLALCLLACVAAVFFITSGPAMAIGGAIGGGGGGIFNGGTLTRGLVFSGVSSDISTPANEDLSLTSGGTGVINLFGGSTTNGLKVSTVEANGNALIHLYTTNVGRILLSGQSDGAIVGTGYSSAGATDPQFTASRGITSSSHASLLSVYGRGTVRHVPNNALTISNPTDTSSTPLGSGTTGAGTACRMSAAGAAAWTPSETGAVDGMYWCCTNTGANGITMTESAGVYEGPATASAVGQWDTVCFEYVTDRFVERSFSNN